MPICLTDTYTGMSGCTSLPSLSKSVMSKAFISSTVLPSLSTLSMTCCNAIPVEDTSKALNDTPSGRLPSGAITIISVCPTLVVSVTAGSLTASSSGSALGSTVGSALGSALGSTVGSAVGSALGSAVGSALGSALGSTVGSVLVSGSLVVSSGTTVGSDSAGSDGSDPISE